MFDYVGSKLQLVGKIMTWLGIGASVVIGIILFTEVSESKHGFLVAMEGIGAILIGSLLSWVTGLFVIGFGELIENSAEWRKDRSYEEEYSSNLSKLAAETPDHGEDPAEEDSSLLTKLAAEAEKKKKDEWICPNCQSYNDKLALQCKNCGRYR